MYYDEIKDKEEEEYDDGDEEVRCKSLIRRDKTCIVWALNIERCLTIIFNIKLIMLDNVVCISMLNGKELLRSKIMYP